MEALEIRAITLAGAAFVTQCVALPDVSSLALCLGAAPNFTVDSRFLQRVTPGVSRVRETLTLFRSPIAALSAPGNKRAMGNTGADLIVRVVGRLHVGRPFRRMARELP